MRSSVARLSTILVTMVLLLSACGGAQAPSTSTSAPTAAAAAPTAAPAEQPTAASAQPTAASSGGAATGEPIPIGIAVAQTSNVALFGQEQVAGAQIAEQYFNEKGGVNGRPIKLVLQDTGGDAAGTINAFNQLINNDKVVGIVGPTLSQQAFAAELTCPMGGEQGRIGVAQMQMAVGARGETKNGHGVRLA